MSPNLSAFLHVIREGETNQTDAAYTEINGGLHFNAPPWVHPYDGIPTTKGGRAAGAYQFLGTTWHELGLPDFSPPNQDQGAALLIDRRGAMAAVEAGDLVTAVQKLAEEWVSLPGLGANRVSRVFAQYGGSESPQSAVAHPDIAEPSPQPQSAPMPIIAAVAAILNAFGPTIGQMVPQLTKILKPGSVSAQRDANNVQQVLNVLTTAAGTLPADAQNAGLTHVAAAVEKMQGDPSLVQDVTKAVINDPQIMTLIEIGQGGIAGARAANVIAPDARWWSAFAAPVFVFGLILCAMVFMVLGNALGMPWGGSFQEWSSEIRASVISAVITGGLGAITGYWFGTTVTSAKREANVPPPVTTDAPAAS